MKKLTTLHILNGDATLPAFKAANLPGQVLVWREILSEGPAVASLPAHEFWQQRQSFITATYPETPEGYQQKVLHELVKIEAAGTFFEVVLWFDSDLMCQINLLYLLHRLYQRRPKLISLCTPPQGQNISLMTANELQLLFNQRQQLTDLQLKQAQAIWLLYASPDPMQLQRYLTENTILLPELQQALQLHLRRFPGCTNGLSHPELALLELMQLKVIARQKLMELFWRQYPGYGFGDLQIEHILQRLQPAFVQKEDHLTLTELGEQMLQGKKRYITETRWLGGAKLTHDGTYCYNPESQQLEKS